MFDKGQKQSSTLSCDSSYWDFREQRAGIGGKQLWNLERKGRFSFGQQGARTRLVVPNTYMPGKQKYFAYFVV